MAILPLEIQILVIEWVFRASQHARIDYATLRACALVCRAWTATAQRLLFRRISPDPYNDYHRRIPLLIHTLRTCPHLSAHVRSVRLGPPMLQKDPAAADGTIAMLELVPHIEGITFATTLSRQDWSADLEARMRALPLRPAFLALGGEPTVVNRIVKMWPTIRVLATSTLRRPIHAARRTLRVLPTVQALTLHSSNIADLSPKVPLPALHDLTLLHPFWTNPVHSEHLRAVGVLSQIRILQLRGAFPPQDVIDDLEQLEGLIIDGPPAQTVSLPKSLHHFGYHSDRDTRADTGIVTAALCGLPNLQRVTVTRQGHPDMRSALEEMCRSCGADFEMYESADSFMRPRHIDWI
ncbi:hypothetical protein FA95DRAFT_610938 [Auriscalpium vulgare]|uniref:Uncharacterized protein n=1 Tax=Auriscalpium vulgare TaxID=40419 RepID=A0ACB8REY8_9AGAM|nr:hypothetical protein FA95DRAFT_610938 [Auriscalpium vulgare]